MGALLIILLGKFSSSSAPTIDSKKTTYTITAAVEHSSSLGPTLFIMRRPPLRVFIDTVSQSFQKIQNFHKKKTKI